MESKRDNKRSQSQESKNLIAKKDWHLYCPPHLDLKIKKGDDLKDVPKKFLDSLKAEGVI